MLHGAVASVSADSEFAAELAHAIRRSDCHVSRDASAHHECAASEQRHGSRHLGMRRCHPWSALYPDSGRSISIMSASMVGSAPAHFEQISDDLPESVACGAERATDAIGLSIDVLASQRSPAPEMRIMLIATSVATHKSGVRPQRFARQHRTHRLDRGSHRMPTPYRISSFIAPSSPSKVSGYMRSSTISLTILIDGVHDQLSFGTGFSQTTCS